MVAYVRSESVVSRVIAGETLIIPIRKNVGDLAAIYSLNDVASTIWEMVARPCNYDEIVSAVQNEFSSEGEQIKQDVQTFIDEMSSLGLISPSATGVAA